MNCMKRKPNSSPLSRYYAPGAIPDPGVRYAHRVGGNLTVLDVNLEPEVTAFLPNNTNVTVKEGGKRALGKPPSHSIQEVNNETFPIKQATFI